MSKMTEIGVGNTSVGWSIRYFIGRRVKIIFDDGRVVGERIARLVDVDPNYELLLIENDSKPDASRPLEVIPIRRLIRMMVIE